MQFEINLKEELTPSVYRNYSKFVYDEVLRFIKRLSYQKKDNYKIREFQLLNSSSVEYIKWDKETPDSLDILYYINHCLVLKKRRGIYYITLDEHQKIKGSKTKVSKVIRLLEFGNEEIRELPVIRRAMTYYSRNYKALAKEYIARRLGDR